MLKRHEVEILLKAGHRKTEVALTWALEVGDVQRFSSIKKAISYCGRISVVAEFSFFTPSAPL